MRYHFTPVRMAIVKKINKDLKVISTLTVYDPKFKITQTLSCKRCYKSYIYFICNEA